MSFLGGITWRHPDFENVVIHSIPINLSQSSSDDEEDLPGGMEFLTSPEFGEVVDIFTPFISEEKYGPKDYQKAKENAFLYKERGNEKFRDGEYRDAFKRYQCSWRLFQLITDEFPELEVEVVHLLSNLSATCNKLSHGKEALEFAEQCLKHDPTFVKGYFRRAEARKMIATNMSTESDEDQKKCMEHLMYAMHDYMKCYEKMVDPKHQNSRIKQYCEALRMALVMNCLNFLPEIHKEDRSVISAQVLEQTILEYQPKLAGDLLDYLIFKRHNRKGSGLMHLHPCDCSGYSVRPFLKKKILTIERLTALHRLNFAIRNSDILMAIEDENCRVDNIIFWYRMIEYRSEGLDKSASDYLTEIYDAGVKTEKIPFVRWLLFQQDAKPSKQACIKSLKLFRNDPKARAKMFECCTVSIRTEMVMYCFTRGEESLLDEVLQGGEIKCTHVDLCKVINSPLIAKNPNHLLLFLRNGAMPNGTVVGAHPVTALLKATHLSLDQKIDLLVILIEEGASFSKMSTAYSDPMSAIHIATKLSLESGKIRILKATCDKFHFPDNGRLVDKNNQTPLHLACLAKNIPTSIKVLEVLTQYNIDKGVLDINQKRAEDYVRSADNDKGRFDFVHYEKVIEDVDLDQIDEFNDKKLKYEPMFKFVVSEDKEDPKMPPNAHVIDMSKLQREAAASGEPLPPPSYGVDGQHKGKWVGNWARFLMPYDPKEKRTQDHYEGMVQQLRTMSKDYIRIKSYENAVHAYVQAANQYDTWKKNYPEAEVDEEKGLIYLNMSLCLFKLRCYPDALTAAEDACTLLPKYYKSHYRRAIANHYYAQSGVDSGHNCVDVRHMFVKAMNGYATTYNLMIEPEQVQFRSQLICDILRVGLEKGSLDYVPKFHKFDEPTIVTKIIKNLVDHKDPADKKCSYIDVVLVKSNIPKSGFGAKLPCEFTNLSVAELLPHPSVNLLNALLAKNYVITLKDLKQAADTLSKEHIEHMKILTEHYNATGQLKQATTGICNELVVMEKLYFVPFFLALGAKPSPSSILSVREFCELEVTVAEYVAKVCDINMRTKALKKSLNSSSKHHVSLLLSSGSIQAKEIDLAEFILSPTLLKKPDFVEELIAAGVSPLGLSQQKSSPLAVLFGCKTVTPLQLTRIGESLMSHGAVIKDMKVAYEDKLTPVHIATKLALETGNMEFLTLVCSKTTFPLNGRVIDGHIQTPFHLAVRAKYNDKSVQVCEVLCQYCIDPKLRDQWNKSAQDYCRAKSDKRLPYLKKAAKTFEEMNRRKSTTILTDAPPQEGSETGKKKKKKKKRNKKEKKDADPEEDGDSNDEKEDQPIKSSPAPLIKPAELVYDINSFLLKIMSFGDEYFANAHPSANSSIVDPSTALEEKKAETLHSWVSGDAEYEDFMKYYRYCRPDPDISNMVWEVECSDAVMKFLKDVTCPYEIKAAVVETIATIASGKWHPCLCYRIDSTIKEASIFLLFEAYLSSSVQVLWDITIQFSPKRTPKDIPRRRTTLSQHVYSETIRVWDIVCHRSNKDTIYENIFKSQLRGLKANIDFTLVPQVEYTPQTITDEEGNTVNIPEQFFFRDSFDFRLMKPPYPQPKKYIPAASIKEDEFTIYVFYSFTTEVAMSILKNTNPRRDFPIKEWPKEHDLINMPHDRETILLVGRSGTGKTTCCLYRLWYQFSDYWKKAGTIGACQPTRPLLLKKPSRPNEAALADVQSKATPTATPPATSSADGDKLEHLHQVFVTKNYVLCSQMKKRFYDMAVSNDNFAKHMEYENQALPTNLNSVHNLAFPLFLTSRQFLLMLDASLDSGKSFFPRSKDGVLTIKISSSDYDQDNPDDALLEMDGSDDEDLVFEEGDNDGPVPVLQSGSKSMPTWQEVTALYFINQIWPKISSGLSCSNMDPLLVWMEIKSFIKGSAQAIETAQGYLSESEYLQLGKKMATNFVGNREEIYKIFLRYENYLQKKRSLNLFDDCQLVHNVFQRLNKLEKDPSWSIHSFYIDEVQDFTQAELSVFIMCCNDPNDLFLTGDTAQSIMRGVAFRFSDLRSLFHYANDRSFQSQAPIRIQVPAIQNLTINFRSHSGILKLASSVIDLMKRFFPTSFDTLPDDNGLFAGPTPTFLQSCQISDLALLLKTNKRTSSSIEFGAHQVIIVQNDEAKNNLPDVLKTGIVLTVFESKGLEFDDVLLYNFFSDSTVDKDWRVVTAYAEQFKYPDSPITLENKPRPLEFNEKEHKSLNAEFKYLYTAITRAKCNLWIYDSDENRRLPILDYWIRKDLVKVIRMGEKEDEDKVLFTATSTPEQWKEQGDYFKRKGLWEPAVKCYHKADCMHLEKEAEAYMFAQMAKSAKNTHETCRLFEKAACAFLYCDHLNHNVKFLTNAAKCLRNSKRHSEAAKLFEKLGEPELAKKSFMKAKDYNNIARLREMEGDYSGAVRVFARYNQRLQALERAQLYEKRGLKLEIDVSLFQLANEYAKYYQSRRDEGNLSKVLVFIEDSLVRVAHLKNARLYHLALDEYLMCKKEKEAVDLILAQEMYEHGFSLAAEEGEREVKKGVKLGPLFKLHYATSEIFHSRNTKSSSSTAKGTRRPSSFDSILEFLLDLTKDNNELVTRAKAKLLSGIIQEKPALCLEAMTLYINGPLHDTIGSLEAFNQAVNLGKTDCSLRLIVGQCFQSKEISSLCVGKSAKSTQIMKLAARFYHFTRLEDVYLLPRSQDIWFGNIFSLASIKEKPTDENGMIRLNQEKLRKALSARYANFVKEWVEKTAIVRRLKERLQSYRFHKNLSEDRPLDINHDGFVTGTTCEYIEMVDLSMKLAKFVPGSFDKRTLGKLVPNIFSPMISLCMPVSKANCTMIQKCSIVRESLESDLQYFLDDRSLLKPNVDDLFDAWQCSCLMNTAVDMEKRLEEFASKKGPGTPGSVADQENTKPWLFINRKGKFSYHHFFSYILKAYRLIREAYQVIGSIKIIFHCFLSVVSKRPTLQKKLSIHNLINVVNICITGLVALLVIDDPDLDLMLPYYYRNQCQLFDDLNIQDSKQFWLLTACVRQIYNLHDSRLARLAMESCDLLSKLLSFLLGDYSEQYNVLDMAVNGSEEMMLMHVMVSVLVLVVNVRLLGDENARYISDCMKKIIVTVKVGTKLDGPLSSVLMDIHSQLAQVTSVYDVLLLIQVLLSKYKYQPVMARLHKAKSGTMEFKEVSLSSELRNIQVVANSKKPVSTKPMPSKSSSTTKVDKLSETTPVKSTDSGKKDETALANSDTQATTTGTTSGATNTTDGSTGTTGGATGTTAGGSTGTTGGATGTTAGGTTGGATNTTSSVTGTTGSASGTTGAEQQAQSQPQTTTATGTNSDAVLQALQQQLMFILQQKQQLEQYRVLLSQQLLSLQHSPLEDLVLYQQQLLQLRQQEYQANEASKQLELQHQQINFKMLQHYNSQKMFKLPQQSVPAGTTPTIPAGTTPTTSLPITPATTPTNGFTNNQAPPTNGFPNTQAPPTSALPITQAPSINSFQTTQPLPMANHQAPPTNISLPQTPPTQTPPTIVVQPTSSSLSVDTMISRESSIEGMKHSPRSEVFFDSKSPSPIGTRVISDNSNSSKNRLDSIVSSFSGRRNPRGGTIDDGIMDEEMMDLLKQSSQSDFFTGIKPVATPSVIGGDDNELVDQYYCQVCGVSFKSEGSETNLEETNASLASVLFHNTNFETYDDHIKSETHQENYFAHSQFMLFKEQSYSEPRKQLDHLLDNTGCINSANIEQFVFSIRSQLRNFDEEIEEYKDSYKWRNAHSLMVAFVEKMMSLTRQLVKMRTTDSVQVPVMPSASPRSLADLVFVDDDEDDFELEMVSEPTIRHGAGGRGGDTKRRKQRK